VVALHYLLPSANFTALLIAQPNKLVNSATNALSSTTLYLQEGVTFIERVLNHNWSATSVFLRSSSEQNSGK
jgi:hypothetical protein